MVLPIKRLREEAIPIQLNEFFKEHPRVALAFSGGVDSSYLLYEAAKSAECVKAYYVESDFQPAFEREDARRLADELGTDLEFLKVDVLSDLEVAANPENRCYYCKKNIFSTIQNAARQDGFTILMDGTNASDNESDRPGFKALSELSVRSPLRECGLTKDEIRRRSHEAGLFTWDKPAYACLATRIPTGRTIRLEDLRRTERAENILREMGFRDFRVRLIGESAKIQVTEDDFERVLNEREKILSELGEDYADVLLDLKERKS